MATTASYPNHKVILSTLWIFVTLNYLYCDVIGLMDPALLNQYITGKVNDLPITENFLFAGAVLMEIPIAMVLLSRILSYKSNRIAMIATLFVGPTSYYIFFACIEIATTIFIVWYAWNWSGKSYSNN